jgi:hypothetical protein
VNARCLDDVAIESLTIIACDGKNWEAQFPNGRGETPAD